MSTLREQQHSEILTNGHFFLHSQCSFVSGQAPAGRHLTLYSCSGRLCEPLS